MSDAAQPVLAVTQGDPLGIGPEVLLKALAEDAAAPARTIVLGDRDVLERTALDLALPLPATICPSPIGGPASAVWALEEACRLALAGEVQAIVTAPITKAQMPRHGFSFPGQTEFFGERLGPVRPTMMLAGPSLRVALVTTHLPVDQISDAITRERVVAAIRHTHAGLQSWWGEDSPRIAVLGLNPHAGEGGLLGVEDGAIIRPAIEECRAAGIHCEGPLPGDGAFAPRTRSQFDAIVAMYHDQGLAPLKALDGGCAVNLTLGLPVPRTSPDHGSARDIHGLGVADAGSMTAALQLAVRAARRGKRGQALAASGT